MADARPLGLSELARFGFSELEAALKNLEALVGLVGNAGRSALSSLAKAQNPDLALNQLLRLCEVESGQIKKLLNREESADGLCAVLGASIALGDFLVRHPGSLEQFHEKNAILFSRDEMDKAFANDLAGHLEASPEAVSALRASYRNQLIRIVRFDLAQENQVEAVTEVAASLADLAGAALDAALNLARLEFAKADGNILAGELADTRLAVIGMGKCGARELNYISDVDVIFVAGTAGDTEIDRAVEIATKLATRMMRIIDSTASEPMLWQVDPNLRPEGKQGALVRSLESHLSYYQRWAESWEFQALLKARPIAGDVVLGDAYVAALSPMVWASASRENFVESVQRMRERVTANIPKQELDWQIKLGPGGLRDVEFTVQLLQLVHGRTDESVRQRDTVSACLALAFAGYIGRQDAARFTANYKFLRFLEHRIQLYQMRRSHLMPSQQEQQRLLARAVDLKLGADALISRWESVKLDVRALHQQLFYRPLLSASARLDEQSFELTSDQAQDRLRAIGFTDPKGALNHIAALTGGLSRRAAIQKQLLPILLQWLAEGTDPDGGLLAFRRLSESLGESPWYLRMLRDSSGAAQRMCQVLAGSRFATEQFERIPESAAWFERTEDLLPTDSQDLAQEFMALGQRHIDPEVAAPLFRQVRRREVLRTALGAVLGVLTLEQIARSLTDITEQYLLAFTSLIGAHVARENGLGGELSEVLDFGIVAMGRFGGAELGFGSDADVMFVYRATERVAAGAAEQSIAEAAPGERAQRLAEQLVSGLRKYASDPILEFELDLDLRPEGKKGAIVRSLESYRAYYERWSEAWEAQALLRARIFSGSERLQQDFTELADSVRYPQELPDKTVVEIRRIKARVENERLPQGADPNRHVKLGRGSISDVEWLIQLLQLQHGASDEALRVQGTLKALEAAVAGGLLEPSDAETLESAWLLASRVRSAAVLWANRVTDVLPTDRRMLEGMARILEYPPLSASKLEQDYLAVTRRARKVFERLFYGQEASDASEQ